MLLGFDLCHVYIYIKCLFCWERHIHFNDLYVLKGLVFDYRLNDIVGTIERKIAEGKLIFKRIYNKYLKYFVLFNCDFGLPTMGYV